MKKIFKDAVVRLYRLYRDNKWSIFEKKHDQAYLRMLDQRMVETNESIYYVISCENMPMQGLFGYVGLILGMIRYALEHNMVPVIDMKNYPNTYLEDNEVGQINAWELFFRQVSKVTIDDLYKSHSYVVGNHMDIDWKEMPNISGYHKKSSYFLWSNMYARFVKLSEQAEKYCQEEFLQILGEEKAEHTLGVLIRGTDIKTCKGHSLQPSLEQVTDKIRSVMKKDKQFQYIYLATEERMNEEYLREQFPGKVLINKRTYYDNADYVKGLSYVKMSGERDKYRRGMEYLSSMYILSKCGGLMSGQCGGGFAAFYMNGGKYRYDYFWELGVVE